MEVKEFLKPLKNIDEMIQAVKDKRPYLVVKNYLESVPGILALKIPVKLAAYSLGKVAVSKGVSSSIAAKGVYGISKGYSTLANIYSTPAKWVANLTKKGATTVVKSPVIAPYLSAANLALGSVVIGAEFYRRAKPVYESVKQSSDLTGRSKWETTEGNFQNLANAMALNPVSQFLTEQLNRFKKSFN